MSDDIEKPVGFIRPNYKIMQYEVFTEDGLWAPLDFTEETENARLEN